MQEAGFLEAVRREYVYEAGLAGLRPKFSRSVIHDAFQCYKADIERLVSNMKTSPDHFKRSGCLAYWLRRHNPVYDWEEENDVLPREQEMFKKRIIDYGHVHMAFMLGYKACLKFAGPNIPASKSPSELDADYIETVSYLMKYKSISPHAMGMIYRSLFFV